jgi:hypothetical protein
MTLTVSDVLLTVTIVDNDENTYVLMMFVSLGAFQGERTKAREVNPNFPTSSLVTSQGKSASGLPSSSAMNSA